MKHRFPCRFLFGCLSILFAGVVQASDFQSGLEAYNRRDYARALAVWNPLAEAGDAQAQYSVGYLHAGGLGVQRDPVEAVRWYRKAAEQGHGMGQTMLGYMYANGLGVERDDAEAVWWYQKGVAQGVPLAQGNLGMMYAQGRGVPQDYEQAASLSRRAAEQGNATAQHNLGLMYMKGLGVEQDPVEAVRWYREAAEQGLAQAQVNLALAYLQATGVPRDDAQAAAWYEKAAEQGLAVAQNDLGTLYLQGHGVAADPERARILFRRAADQGLAIAQHNLGYVYETGLGVPQNENIAVMWYQKAADQGYGEASARLAYHYEHGRGGLARDPEKALEYYRLAGEDNTWAKLQYQRLAASLDDDGPVSVEWKEPEESWVPWWLRGFSISPAFGLRHVSLGVVDRRDGYTGNIANSASESMSFFFNAETPQWTFGNSPFGLSLFMHSAAVGLSEQFFEDGGTNPNGTASGNRWSVGTSISGYYSYLLPALSFSVGEPGGAEFRMMAGYGTWIADLSGTILLAEDKSGGPDRRVVPINIKVRKKASLLLLSYRTQNNWLFQMTSGGPSFRDRNYDYNVTEISFVIGKTFIF